MTPNTRKPTKKQVSDSDMCWVWNPNPWFPNKKGSWHLRHGFTVRTQWHRNDRWLPYSAIPDPNNTQQGEPK